MLNIYSIDFIVNIACLPISFIGLFLVILNHWIDKRSRMVYGAFFFFQTLFLTVCLLTQVAFFAEHVFWEQWLTFAECLIGYLFLLCFMIYLLYYAGISPKTYWPFWLAVGLGLIYFAMQIIAQHTTLFYYFGEDGTYYRGPLAALMSVPIIVKLLVDLIITIRYRKNMKKVTFVLFTVMACLLLVSCAVEFVTSYETLTVYLLVAGSVIVFADIFDWQDLEIQRRQDELVHQRANNLILQMRPHFIYNTMMSIYYLCEQDTKKAQQVILDFSSYLQKNFSALDKEGTIPFIEELEHTRAYLAVETARFEDQLSVEFDTPCTMFSLPALTLQPIVENAVKHGIDPEHAAIHIRISTRETDRDYEICVENDGATADIQSVNAPGSAIANIRHRLDSSCGGKLTFTARENATVVTITLPKKAQKNT